MSTLKPRKIKLARLCEILTHLNTEALCGIGIAAEDEFSSEVTVGVSKYILSYDVELLVRVAHECLSDDMDLEVVSIFGARVS